MANTLVKDPNAQSIPLFVLGNDPEIVDGTSASAASAVIDADDFTLVQLYASADCNIKVAAAPTATTSTMALPGSQILHYIVRPGDKIAVLGASLQITKHNG